MHQSRRVSGSTRPDLAHHPLVDLEAHGLRARDGSRSIPLSPLPFRLLRRLAEAPPGAVVRHDDLARAGWPADRVVFALAEGRVREQMHALRDTAEAAGWERDIITAARGVGYRLNMKP